MNIVYSFPYSITSVVGILVIVSGLLAAAVLVRPRLARESKLKEEQSMHDLPEKVCLLKQ